MAKPKGLPKPRNAYALHALMRTGAGVHTPKPKYEPTVEEFLDEMAEEQEENEKILSDYLDEENEY